MNFRQYRYCANDSMRSLMADEIKVFLTNVMRTAAGIFAGVLQEEKTYVRKSDCNSQKEFGGFHREDFC